MSGHPIPKEEFDAIFSRVPRLTVEIILRTDDGVVLTKRSMEPRLGQWHIPGGTVRFGESLIEAVKRVAKDELNVDVEVGKLLGYIEYPKMAADGYNGWPIGMAFEADIINGELNGSEQGEEVGCFKKTPSGTISEQARFLNQCVFNDKEQIL
jgi:ADP-ribose pyrophosphatase YjhB (NUDIX family)